MVNEAKIRRAIGISDSSIDVFPKPVLAARAPTTTDNDYPRGQKWIFSNQEFTFMGGGVWDEGGTGEASTTEFGVVKLDDDLTVAAANTVPTSVAAKAYTDSVAIAGAPDATESTKGISELANTTEGDTGTEDVRIMTSLKVASLIDSGNIPATFTTLDSTGVVVLNSSGTVSLDGTVISIDGTSSSNFGVSGAGVDLTLDSSAGQLILTGGEAAANAVRVEADNAAGGIDVDAGTGGIAVDSTGAISIDAAAASNFTVTGAFDLTLDSTLGAVNITSGQSANDSIVIESTIGGIDILASGAAAGEDIDIIATGSSVNISASEAVATAINIDATAGGIDVDAAGQINIATSQSANDSIVITSSAGGIDILAAGAAAGEDIDLIATGSSVNVSSTENAALAIYLHANGGTSETVDIHADQGTGVASINVHSDVGGLTLTSGLASADAININASDAAGGIDVDCGSSGFIVDAASGAISLDSALASNFTVTGAADLTLDSSAGSVIINAEEAVADAIQLQTGIGGIDVDAALQINIASSQNAADAIRLSSSAGGIDMDAVGAAGEDIDILNTGGSLRLRATESAIDAVVIEATLGGIDILASGAAAGEDIDIVATGSSVNISSTENDAGAIYVHANGGTSERIRLHADQGTGTDSILLESDAGGIHLNPGGVDITIDGTVKEVNAEFLDASGDNITFSMSPSTCTAADTGGVATGATGDLNIVSCQQGFTMEQFVLGAGQTIIKPVVDANGLLISGDLTATEGFEYNLGAVRTNSRSAFTIGTSAAFSFEVSLYAADISGGLPYGIGFRKVEANNATMADYTDYVIIGMWDTTSSTNVTILDELNGTGQTATDTTDAWGGDGAAQTLKVLVSSAGVVTFEVGGSAASAAPTYSFDTPDVVVPFIHILHGATTPGAVNLVSWKCGFQA